MSAQSKPWYKSKTIIFNVIMAVAGALSESSEAVKQAFPGGMTDRIMAITFVGNIILRAITTGGITKK